MPKAANAAKKSADALANSERPYLTVGSQSMLISYWDDRSKRTVRFLVHNFGKIPGRLSWWTIQARVHQGLDLPGPPKYPEPTRHYGIVVPNGAIEIQASGDLGLNVDGPQSFGQGDYHLFLYGFIEYQNLDRRVTYGPPVQFCFRFDPNARQDEERSVIAGDQTYWEGKKQHQTRNDAHVRDRS